MLVSKPGAFKIATQHCYPYPLFLGVFKCHHNDCKFTPLIRSIPGIIVTANSLILLGQFLELFTPPPFFKGFICEVKWEKNVNTKLGHFS